ncbi:hypothetical protein [Sansalvadorimonas verongulae]|uniref:hypothetical protein n=1 Tax=Sansalvadorimonas verongulae TaxID=2172824 RepID=UPI0012BCA662|nr:hypothetical protein [Sansalvadorimonas verongulae]MTI15526.1 hypothetical protein [Sansalvadorimonas verongulae]
MKHWLLHYTRYLSAAIAVFVLTGAMAAKGQDDLVVELKRQSLQMWHSRLSEQFDQLAAWFSPAELSQMPDGLMLSSLNPQQLMAVHSFASTALSPLGYLRFSHLIRLQKVQEEMQSPDAIMPVRLMIQDVEGSRMFRIQGPTFSLELIAAGNQWMINQLTMAQWPSQVPPAPKPDLSTPNVHYPFVRWRESVGEMALGQTTLPLIQALTALPDNVRKRTCAGEPVSERQCTLSMLNEIKPEAQTSAASINTKGRFLLNQLLTMLKSHLGSPSLIPEKEDTLLMFSWAGDLPSSDQDRPESLLLNLSDEAGLWQVIVTGPNPANGFSSLPPNGIYIAFSRNGVNERGQWANMPATTQEPMSLEASSALPMMPPVTMTGGAGEKMEESDTDQPTWLKSPTFLNGMIMSLGYMGNNLTTALPLVPVVEIKRGGRPHRNIRVNLSISIDVMAEPWLKDFPLNFDSRTEDYRSSIRLPAQMAGQEITLTFSVHEPGTRYEGIYEYKVKVKGRQVIRQF